MQVLLAHIFGILLLGDQLSVLGSLGALLIALGVVLANISKPVLKPPILPVKASDAIGEDRNEGVALTTRKQPSLESQADDEDDDDQNDDERDDVQTGRKDKTGRAAQQSSA